MGFSPRDFVDLAERPTIDTALRRGISPALIEKDFWVCWVLKKLFTDFFLKQRIVFKGGTSLSKVFGLIDRFSEDSDLVLDWTLLGNGAGMENSEPVLDSRTQRDRFSKQINVKAANYIAEEILGLLNALLASLPGIVSTIRSEGSALHKRSLSGRFRRDLSASGSSSWNWTSEQDTISHIPALFA